MTAPRRPRPPSDPARLRDRADTRLAVSGCSGGRAVHCESCGEPMPPEQLQTSPLQTHCAACREGLRLLTVSR